jgi:hypothetical protein
MALLAWKLEATGGINVGDKNGSAFAVKIKL